MLLSIQMLRAAAALLVLAFHIQHELIHRLGHVGLPSLEFGAAGVDIFFVVSGFIMVWSTRSLPGQPHAARIFMGRRLVRIVPLYWLTTLVFLAGLLAWPPSNHTGIDVPNLIASFLFIPWPNQAGIHAPLYGLGWTLNFEMLFYVVFAACLAFAGRRVVLATSVVLVAMAVIGAAMPGLPFVLKVWTEPLVLEFLAGAWIASARIRGVTLRGPARVGLVMLGFALLAATEWLTVTPGLRPFLWGGPAALIVAGAALGEDWNVHGAVARAVVLLGDASYSLYLVHFLALSMLRRLGGRVLDFAALPPLGYAALAAAVAIAASVAVHLLFERPIHRVLLARLGLGGRAVGQHRPV